MTEQDWARAVGYMLVPIFWLLVMTFALWFVRRFMPRHERMFFDPLTVVLRRAIRRIRGGH